MKVNPYQNLAVSTQGNTGSIKPSTSVAQSMASAAQGTISGNQTADGATFQAELEKAKAEVDQLQKSAQAAQDSGDLEALKKIAKDFEEIFVNMLLKSMRSTIMDGGLTEKSNQRGMFEGMLDEEFAKQISEKGGIGIQEMMVRQLQRYVDQTPPESEEGETPQPTTRIDSKG